MACGVETAASDTPLTRTHLSLFLPLQRFRRCQSNTAIHNCCDYCVLRLTLAVEICIIGLPPAREEGGTRDSPSNH